MQLHQTTISLTLLLKLLIFMIIILQFIHLTLFLLLAMRRIRILLFIMVLMMILHFLISLLTHMVMKDTLEEALMFMGGLSFGLCMQLDPVTINFYIG